MLHELGGMPPSERSSAPSRGRAPKPKPSQQRVPSIRSQPSSRTRSARGGSTASAPASSRARSAASSSAKSVVDDDALDDRAVAARRTPQQGVCGWCGELATCNVSADGPLVQCDAHHKFHLNKLVGMPWPSVCKLYRSDPDAAKELDIACEKYQNGTLKVDGAEEVTQVQEPGHEVYIKYCLLTESDIREEATVGRVALNKTLMDNIRRKVPQVELFKPGTLTRQVYFVFPRMGRAALYPTLKIGTRYGTSKRGVTLQPQVPSISIVHLFF